MKLVQARRSGASVPGAPKRHGVVYSDAARHLVGKRRTDIVVAVMASGQRDVPIVAHRQQRLSEPRPAPPFAFRLDSAGAQHVRRIVGLAVTVTIRVHVLPVLGGDFGARRPPCLTAVERKHRAVQRRTDRPVLRHLIPGQPQRGLANRLAVRRRERVRKVVTAVADNVSSSGLAYEGIAVDGGIVAVVSAGGRRSPSRPRTALPHRA